MTALVFKLPNLYLPDLKPSPFGAPFEARARRQRILSDDRNRVRAATRRVRACRRRSLILEQALLPHMLAKPFKVVVF